MVLPQNLLKGVANMDLMTVKDLAATLKCGVRSVWKMRDSGKLPPPIHPGGTRLCRWRRADVEEWIKAGCPTPRGAGK